MQPNVHCRIFVVQLSGKWWIYFSQNFKLSIIDFLFCKKQNQRAFGVLGTLVKKGKKRKRVRMSPQQSMLWFWFFLKFVSRTSTCIFISGRELVPDPQSMPVHVVHSDSSPLPLALQVLHYHDSSKRSWAGQCLVFYLPSAETRLSQAVKLLWHGCYFLLLDLRTLHKKIHLPFTGLKKKSHVYFGFCGLWE